MYLKQSTSQIVRFGPFVDSTDGFTAEVSLTIAQADMQLSKDGGAFAQKNASGNATHDTDGWYSTTLNTTDTATVGELYLQVVVTGALPVWVRWWVLEEAIYDSLFGASAAGFNASGLVTLAAVTHTGATIPTVTTLTGHTAQTADHTAGIADIPTVAEFNARTLVAASYFDPATDTVATVTDVTNDVGITAGAVDAIWDEVLTGGTHNVTNSAGRRLRQIQDLGNYQGAVWIDTVNGTAGTTDFENGVDTNPVDSIADANTIAASLGISRFAIAPGSSITLAATQANQVFSGSSWTLALGGQSIDGSTFIGATVSGIGTNTADSQYFIDCNMGAVTLPGDTHVITSTLSGNQTLGEAGDYFFDRCHSGVAGTGTPSLDFGAALNASNVSVRNYSGGLEIQNMGAGTGSYTMSLEGRGQLVINANCSATSTVAIRGMFTVTDNAGGAVTLSDDARIDVAQINAQADTALTDYGASTHSAADVWTAVTRTLTANTNLNDPTAAAIADQVWVELVADHSGTSGSTAEALAAAGGAGDPWITALPGAYGAGTAGNIVGNLNDISTADVAGELATYDAPTKAELDAGFAALNDLTAAQVNAEVDTALTDYDAPTRTEATSDKDEILTRLGTPAGADVSADVAAVKVDTAATLVDTGTTLPATLGTPAGADLAADIAAVKAETALIVADTNELQTDDVPGLIAALNDITVADILTTQMTESYAADGAAPTLTQALMLIQQHLGDFAISGTTLTVRQVNGSTTAATFTLDDGTNPTSLTRAS